MALQKQLRRIQDINDGVNMTYHKLNGLQVVFNGADSFTILSFAGYVDQATRQADGDPIGGVRVKVDGVPKGSKLSEIQDWAYLEAKKSDVFNGAGDV